MPHRVVSKTLAAPAIAFLLHSQLAFAQLATPGRTDNRDEPYASPAMTTPTCEMAKGKLQPLLTELEASVPAPTRSSIDQARSGPGVSSAKNYGDQAAAYLLVGNTAVAAWAGLKAAQIEWTGETVTNAGVYLFHYGKKDDALVFLNCAYSSGYRSPYLLEALAIVSHSSGNSADARRYISEAAAADPNDVMIETEASYINTGGPPPARPPQREQDGLDEAIAELDQHAKRAINLIKTRGDIIDNSIPDAKAGAFAQISIDYISKLVPVVREQAQAARNQPVAARQIMINMALNMCISSYAQITDTMLTFLDTTETNGSPIIFWGEVMRIDPPVLQREQDGGWSEAIRWSMHGQGDALSQPWRSEYFRDKEAGRNDFNQRERACKGDQACRVRETARWCGVRKRIYQKWEEGSRQRHNMAARRFDQVATRWLMAAENEYLQIRDYAVRQLKKMKFPPPQQGQSMEKMTVDSVNSTLKFVYDKHLGSGNDGGLGTVSFLRDRASWFTTERDGIDEILKVEADEIQRECEPAIRALLELLAQEEWQAYLDHLKDRLSWSVQPKTEESFPCEGSIGPLTIEADLNKPGEGKMDLKWKGKSFSGGGSVIFGPNGPAVGVGGSAKTSGVTLSAGGDSSGNGGFGGSTSSGPFQGKAKVSFTSKRSPWNNQDYLGIKIKGSAGLGLSNKTGSVGVKCFPSSGSITIYPRAFYEDAVKYLSTPSSPPGRTR